ncbi:TPA: hypothetical protein P1K35_003638 [Providencia rettgeri]
MKTKNNVASSDCHTAQHDKISQVELNHILNNIKNHRIQNQKNIGNSCVSTQLIHKYSDVIVLKEYRNEERRIYRDECNAAFKFTRDNCMKGSFFSLAQQLANQSGENILAMDDKLNSTFSKKKLFRPQPPFIAFISALGYTLFGRA